MKKKILVVDDEKNIREGIKKFLTPLGYSVILASDGKEALKTYLTENIQLVILDIQIPKKTGMEVLEEINKTKKPCPVLMITGHGDVEIAVKAMQLGAYDFITKPLNLEKIELLLERALKLEQLKKNQKELIHIIKDFEIEKEIIGNSQPMKNLRSQIKKIAPSKGNVYIFGETGTGKEVICDAIHKIYGEKKPLIKVNCAALNPSLLESELFGHEKGAFTGAEKKKIGRFEMANSGTLFLDEVSEMPKEIQIKLLRVLQEREIERVGGSETIKTDFRLICASNKDLKEEIEKGNFREDLFYRINVLDITVPPLRKRENDIILLSQYFFDYFIKQNGMEGLEIEMEIFKLFKNYQWQGNIRELKNTIEKCVIMSDKKKITIDDLPEKFKECLVEKNKKSNISIPLGKSMDEMEELIFKETIKYFDGNVDKAKKILKIEK